MKAGRLVLVTIAALIGADEVARADDAPDPFEFLRDKVPTHYIHFNAAAQTSLEYESQVVELGNCNGSIVHRWVSSSNAGGTYDDVTDLLFFVTGDKQKVVFSGDTRQNRMRFAFGDLDPGRINVESVQAGSQRGIPAGNWSYGFLRFTSRRTAERVARALGDAIKKCGGKAGY